MRGDMVVPWIVYDDVCWVRWEKEIKHNDPEYCEEREVLIQVSEGKLCEFAISSLLST